MKIAKHYAEQRARLIGAVVVSIFWSAQVLGANSVVIESKTVPAGATEVTVGVYITNDIDLTGLVLPLEFREVDPGCYITNSLILAVQGRMATSGLMDLTSGPYYGPVPATAGCSGPTSDAFDIDTLGAADFVSPDGVFWAGLNAYATNLCLAAGSDGSGNPSFLFTFDVTGTVGTFEIDTCCHSPANHILFVPCGTAGGVTPAFTKGEIEVVECNCGVWGDVNADDEINPVDVVYMVNFVYKNDDMRVQPPNCAYEAGDVDCDNQVNPVDVVRYVNYVYKNLTPWPCEDPCNP